MKPTNKVLASPHLPLFKSPALMATVSGIGENTLRALMDSGKLAYLPVGNRRLLTDEALLEFYKNNKVSVHTA